ncbi:hypothetical protein D3C80_1172650 [compost metagenome]
MSIRPELPNVLIERSQHVGVVRLDVGLDEVTEEGLEGLRIIAVTAIPVQVRPVEFLTELDACEIALSRLVGLHEDRGGIGGDLALLDRLCPS